MRGRSHALTGGALTSGAGRSLQSGASTIPHGEATMTAEVTFLYYAK